MKRFFLTLGFFISVLALTAQIPNGYYNAANGKTGDELKAALHNIIKGHHVVSYEGLLNAFAYTDCKPNGKIWDIYSNYEYSLSGNCGEYEQEGDCWNREHTWPQSWFNEKTTPRSDLFHVYPTDGYVNGQRSNYPYGEVNNPTYTSGNGSKLGPCVTSGYSGKVFEPIDEYKGDIARSYFYMSVRYYSEDSGWGSSGMTNKSEILPWAMTMLLRWSDEDPVSDKEIARNNAVYGYQNNRNPFIDHPEYARMIWDENWQPSTTYIIAIASCEHGEVCSDVATATEGQTVNLTAEPDNGYEFGSWNVYKTDAPSVSVTVNNSSFVMPAYNVTVSATFIASSGGNMGNGDYVKVTSAPSDWSGEYLIVCEAQNVAFNGTVENYWGRCSSVSINENTIESNAITDSYKVTISSSNSGYTFLFPDGKYMNWTTEKKFSEGTTPVVYLISLSNDSVNISYGNCHLQYNHNNGSGGLRSYKTNQTPIQLYKKTDPQTVTQSISLAQGWNWWAPTVETTLEALQTALGDTIMQIKSQGGTPTELVLGQMYRIQASAPCQFTLSGLPATGVEVTITQGCNWFGFTGTEPLSLTALGISPATGDKVVSQDGGFAIYNGSTWVGTLTHLQPGQGYVYHSTAEGNKTLVLP